MNIDVKTIRDTISPDLARMIRACKEPRRALEAMGAALVSLTVRAFRDESLRPTPWKPVKRAGSPLYRSGALKHSIRVTNVTNESVAVGTDRPYALWHQLGTKPYTIRPGAKKALFWPGARHPVKAVNHPGLPPRPFFPFTPSGSMTPAAERRLDAAARAAIASMLEK